jgi:hypothetical protein
MSTACAVTLYGGVLDVSAGGPDVIVVSGGVAPVASASVQLAGVASKLPAASIASRIVAPAPAPTSASGEVTSKSPLAALLR